MDLDDVNKIMLDGVRKRVFPGGVLCVWSGGDVVFHEAYGVSDPLSCFPVKTDTVFDLASLTKPLATAPAVLKLADMGRLSVEDRLCDLLPVFKGTDKENITLSMLLCHASGMPAHREYFRFLSLLPDGQRNGALIRMLADEPLEYDPGSRVVYSDLGYMLLRFVVEKAAGKRFDRFVCENLYEPLGITDLFFVPHRFERLFTFADRDFAPTGYCRRRGTTLCGVVHDDNAYEAGGFDGHAGLFGTTGAALDFLVELLSIYRGRKESGVLSRESARLMLERQRGTSRTFGFDTPSMEGSASGTLFSENSVGHLGFTGTSCWIDIERDIIILLFTNRVFFKGGNDAIKSFRPRIHDAVMSWTLGL